jgi:hypothetical protein
MAKNPPDDKPRISQISYGPHSPNIVGDHNTVTHIAVNQERRLSDEQKSLLISRMLPFAGFDGEHLVDSMFGNGESMRFAMDFVDVFRRAGWVLTGSGFSQSMYAQPCFGIIITVRTPTNVQIPALRILIGSLIELGIQVTICPQESLKDGQFRIVVGHKD